jgi:hypothetical protein
MTAIERCIKAGGPPEMIADFEAELSEARAQLANLAAPAQAVAARSALPEVLGCESWRAVP